LSPLIGAMVTVIDPLVGAVCPATTLVLVGVTVSVKSGESHPVTRAFTSSEPSPVTVLYLWPPATEKPKLPVDGHCKALGKPVKTGVPAVQGTMLFDVSSVPTVLVPVFIS
jgi:hypothetical protein